MHMQLGFGCVSLLLVSVSLFATPAVRPWTSSTRRSWLGRRDGRGGRGDAQVLGRIDLPLDGAVHVVDVPDLNGLVKGQAPRRAFRQDGVARGGHEHLQLDWGALGHAE
eukprot:scaffold1461_cov253-Pinguiococcus_pyrenoidosus.AAC.20